MSKYLGNNFWLLDGNRVFNTKTQLLSTTKDLPPNMKWKKSVGHYKVEDRTDFKDMSNGYRFVMFDFCESIRSHKKTTNVVFIKFKTFNKCWRKFDSIKEKGGWIYFDYEFYPNRGYKLLCEINHDFLDSVRILESKEL